MEKVLKGGQGAAEKACVEMLRVALLLAATVSGAIASSPVYMVIRLNHAESKSELPRHGTIEIANPDLRSNEILVSGTEAQIEELRQEPVVEFVYPASEDLIQGAPVSSCAYEALHASELQLAGEYVANVGQGWTNGRKSAARLTYSFGYITPKLDRSEVMEAVQRAMAEWSRYVQVDFTYATRTDAVRNLNFLFASGDHGDSYPFDGRGRQLAHTFYPAGINAEPIAGDLHFDEAENWQTGVDPDFYSVTLHELGHALGLGHADRPNAVMYPYYRKLEQLRADDIQAIRRLYASRQDSTPTLIPVPAAQSGPSNSKDRTAPTLKITSPGTTIYSTSADTVRITGTATDNLEVTGITWTASGGRSGTAIGASAWTIPDFALRLGDNTIVIRARDEAGNTSWRSLTITRR